MPRNCFRWSACTDFSILAPGFKQFFSLSDPGIEQGCTVLQIYFTKSFRMSITSRYSKMPLECILIQCINSPTHVCHMTMSNLPWCNSHDIITCENTKANCKTISSTAMIDFTMILGYAKRQVFSVNWTKCHHCISSI